MHIVLLSTVRASATRCQYQSGSQMSKFEQVSSDGQQMSLEGVGGDPPPVDR